MLSSASESCSYRSVQARRRGYMVEDAVMAAHPDIPTAQKEIQRTEVRCRPCCMFPVYL